MQLRMILIKTAIAIIFLTVPSVAQINFENISNIECVLQHKLDSLTSNHLVPGITLSVRFGDDKNISIASGLSDLENKIPMQPDAVMFSGSVGKTYVAAVILKLYKEGAVDLKSKAKDYLRDVPWFSRIPNANEVTIEMLLNHTAGVPEYVYYKELWQEVNKNPGKEWSVEERLSYIFDSSAVNEPGKSWSYADSHFIILGLIIEKVTGRKYYDVLNEYILKPYNLNNTFPADNRTISGLIAGYTILTEDFLLPRKVLTDNKYAFNPQLEWTGGGLVSTVSDLSLWAKLLYGRNVLKPETKSMMLTPAPFDTDLFEEAKYGLGCFIGETDGVVYYGHTGFVPGYITFIQYLPLYDIAFAMQFNDDSSHSGTSMKEFFNTIKKCVINNCKKD